MCLPTFVIVGAMKAGTTSLHSYLKLHRDIYMSEEKELDFFYHPLKWKKGINWYKKQFNCDFNVRGEVSPNYYKREESIKRMFKVLPDVKIIFLTRDPIARFTSECNHMQVDPNEKVKSENLLSDEVFINSLYFNRLKAILKYYAKNNILVIKSEDLRQQQTEVLKSIFDFLKVSDTSFDFSSNNLNEEAHVTKNKELNTKISIYFNSSIVLKRIKSAFVFLKPLLFPVWKRLAYRKRIIRELSEENQIKLKGLFELDLQMLDKKFGINYNYE